MMRPIDIEVVVANALRSNGFTATATPLPPDFDNSLPFMLVTCAGGNTRHESADTHAVSVDVYASTWVSAHTNASLAIACVRSMVGSNGVYDADCSMKYTNPDPRHKSLPRVTFTARITAAGEE